MRDLTIVTLSRNGAYLAQLFAALKDQLGAPGFLHVVVNNSGDADLTALALSNGCVILDPGYNTTYSNGNNLAVELAQKASPAEWLLFLNDDAIPLPTWLSELWLQRSLADVVGCLLLNDDDDGTVNHAGTRVGPRGDSDHMGRGESCFNFSGFAYTPAVTFAAALMRADRFDEVGGFDSRYNYGFEDIDLCMKVLAAGGRIGCARDAVAVHGECGTRPRGGQADSTNRAQFIQTWQSRLARLLTDYEKDQPGVEGIWH